MTFPYPGDSPYDMYALITNVDDAQREISLFATNAASAQKSLAQAWSGRMQQMADADIAKLAQAGPTLAAKLTATSAALSSYASTLSAVRAEVDSINDQHDKIASVLQSEQHELSLSGKFADANNMNDQQLATYRGTIQSDERRTQGQLDALSTQYDAQVTKASTAAHTAAAALTGASREWTYNNGPVNASLADGFGFTGLQVNHFYAMIADAKQFETDVAKLNEPGLDPTQRQARINALLARYGADVIDADFATTVANDKGVGYFQKLQADIGTYQRFTGASYGYDTDKALFRLNAQILATATNQDNPVHVSPDWVHSFFYDKRNGIQPNWIMTAADYESAGVPFATSFLDATGTAAIDWETRPGNVNPMTGYLNTSWGSLQLTRFPGGDPVGLAGANDPLTAVMNQYANRPDTSSVLFADQPNGDPGNLFHLLHRGWGDGGATALGHALDAETGPYNPDHQAAAQIAHTLIHDVGQGDPKYQPEIPGQLRDPLGTIVGRYMGSIVADGGGSDSTSGLDTLLNSANSGEPQVGRVHFGQADLAKSLSWIYHDTNDTAVRETLAQSWANGSADQLAGSIANTQAGLHDPAHPYNPGFPDIRGSVNNSAHVLGLLTQSDINGFSGSAEDQRAAAEARKALFEKVVGLIPIPDLPEGTAKIFSTIYDSSIETVKGMAGQAFDNTDPQAVADHHNQVELNVTDRLQNLPVSTITALSNAGIPIISVPGPGGTYIGTTAEIPPAGVQGYETFVDPQTHRLRPYSEIQANGGKTYFENWYKQQTFFGGSDGYSQLTDDVSSAYTDGARQANQ